ncbi:MAG: tripartite tricarboxylate transporter substrate binding protein [Burkholderiales bacterium]
MRTLIAGLASLFICGGWAQVAIAQDYPVKPIRLIIPFPPGGSNDIVGRMLAMQLSERLGKQIVIDNRGGAGGVIGTELAAKAPADGYTLLLISTAYALNTSLYKLPYDPATAFTPVATLGTGPNVLVVNAKLPVSTVKELIALAKAKPGQLNYASAGVGSFQHLGGELFRIMAGIDVVHVPFKGGGPATTDVIAGSTQYSLGSLINMIPHIRAGTVRALGMGGAARSPLLPDIPTIAEAGVPDYEAANWWGILAPAGTPAGIVRRLNNELSGLVNSDETRRRLDAEGAQALQMSPEAFGKLIAAETAKWARVIKEAGIKPE